MTWCSSFTATRSGLAILTAQHPGHPGDGGGADHDKLRAVHERAYGRSGLVVAAAGNVEHGAVVDAVGRHFESVGNGGAPPTLAEAGPFEVADVLVERPGAQTHVVMGNRTFPHADARRFALILLSTAVGGGMSSRLFQRVREELGLAYAVYSFQSFYRDGGALGVYVATRPEWADRAVGVIREELQRVAREGLLAAELEDAKGQVKGQLVLGLESAGGRLHRLALQELQGEPHRTVDELLARIDGRNDGRHSGGRGGVAGSGAVAHGPARPGPLHRRRTR
jgi:predicted Zn-dependent peptidase